MEQNTANGKFTLQYLSLLDNQVVNSGTKAVKYFYQSTLRLEITMKVCAGPPNKRKLYGKWIVPQFKGQSKTQYVTLVMVHLISIIDIKWWLRLNDFVQKVCILNAY